VRLVLAAPSLSNVYLLPIAVGLALTAQAAPTPFAASDAGTTYGGPVAGADWGRPLACGDLDGDGFEEVLVAASQSSGGFLSRVYVLRGGPRAHGRGEVDLSTTPPDQVILGAELDDNLGSSVAAGDVNGDGVDDLLVCASTADYAGIEDRGIAYLIYGGSGFFTAAVRDLADPNQWSLRILGPVAGGDMGGSNLFGGLDAQAAGIGRLNNDVYGDIALGVHLATGGGSASGRVYVIFGGPIAPGWTLNLAVSGQYNVRINGRAAYDELGTVVLTGDLTGDGLDELILPNQYASRGLLTSEGAVHIFRGRATWANTYNLASTPADVTLWGARRQDELGASAAVGDFNGDGRTDLAVGAPGADAGALNTQRGDGFVYGLLGSPAYQTGMFTIDYATATPDFLLVGEGEENLGTLVSAGDFNGDGVSDIAAAEWFGGPETNGVVEVLFGRSFAAGETYTANVDTDLHIVGAANDRISFSLGAADTNGDGLNEILFGTPFNNEDRGTVYVFTYVSGDADLDGDRDVADFAIWQACVMGPPQRGLSPPCVRFDFNLDENIDGADLAAFAARLGGPGP